MMLSIIINVVVQTFTKKKNADSNRSISKIMKEFIWKEIKLRE